MPLKLKSLIFFISFSLVSHAMANSLNVLVGPRIENLQKISTDNSRTNPLSILTEYSFRLRQKLYLSLSASGEFDLSSFSSVGFGLYSFINYYIVGEPDLIRAEGKDARITLTYPYSVFVGLGLFQKKIRFDNGQELDVEEDLGGAGIVIGGSYDLTEKYYFVTQTRYLVSGSGTDTEYTSLEFYGGLGIRF